ncbi:YegS/Rv2252/BmrU family lipid kinase [Tropicimonas isoalkanivorans]|uniref:Lipid kinase YegS n=1 Tax=Tropicimonas isoalkanivorans TaxID=441112 RepID=A0A1I1PGV2_9RHOB|nr:YegS/Rv2252/BmrU family lipid kinase [Tropicimonas isoalkanivorans]SFD09015.1 lipid kinase YegS [Tropicimonas isoalkanivorans]
MSDRTLLIVNRKSAINDELRDAVKAMQKEHDLDVRIPWSRKQMRHDIDRAASGGCTRVIAAGGDGTINSVVSAVLRLGIGTDVAVGLIPLGTANDFAKVCGVPEEDVSGALLKALTGEARPTDAGRVNKKYFVNVASGGFGAKVTATTPDDMKARLGGFAYTLHGLSQLGGFEPQICRFTMDGGAMREVPLVVMAVGNGRFAGGGFKVTPEAELDDGALDLSIVSDEWQGAPGFLLRELFRREGEEKEAAIYRTFEHGVMETDEDFYLNLDGEPMVGRRFEISVLPKALRVVRDA